MTALKVSFVIQKLAGLSGGAERIISDVANGMAARGMDVEILTYEGNGGAAHYPLKDVKHRNLYPNAKPKAASGGGRAERFIKTVPNIPPIAQAKWAATYGRAIRALQAEFKRNRPDVIVGFMPTGIMLASFAARTLNIPVIGSTHNVPEQDFGDGARWDKNPVYRRNRLKALADVRALTVLLPEFAGWFGPELQGKLIVMPNPVAPATTPLPDAATRPQRVIGVGRLTDIKRYDALIKAFAKLAPEHPDWRLDIFGEGPEREALASLIGQLGCGDQIALAGVTDKIFDVYQDAAILAHPAEFEGFGLSIGEALNHALPVVGSKDCSGLNTLVRHEKNGLLVSDGPDFTDHLAKGLKQLIIQPDLRAQLGLAGPESMKAYAPVRIFDAWQDLVRQVAHPL